jgi:hypothetical protein
MYKSFKTIVLEAGIIEEGLYLMLAVNVKIRVLCRAKVTQVVRAPA